MLKISEYEDRVVECRKMAARTRDLTKKAQFEEIARAWQMLAEARMKQLERRPRSRVEYRQRKGPIGSASDPAPDGRADAPGSPTMVSVAATNQIAF